MTWIINEICNEIVIIYKALGILVSDYLSLNVLLYLIIVFSYCYLFISNLTNYSRPIRVSKILITQVELHVFNKSIAVNTLLLLCTFWPFQEREMSHIMSGIGLKEMVTCDSKLSTSCHEYIRASLHFEVVTFSW